MSTQSASTKRIDSDNTDPKRMIPLPVFHPFYLLLCAVVVVALLFCLDWYTITDSHNLDRSTLFVLILQLLICVVVMRFVWRCRSITITPKGIVLQNFYFRKELKRAEDFKALTHVITQYYRIWFADNTSFFFVMATFNDRQVLDDWNLVGQQAFAAKLSAMISAYYL